ncbi:ATP-binding cassette protein subfamily G, member 6 [Novymonas esmeraldas]|uniref:ATP-binding cassette protein subfamily G, member 6 n=1 Tax=Novymonas esmeraldas TaxID=1808958 RepID=A0AAW0ERA5_9TRYP
METAPAPPTTRADAGLLRHVSLSTPPQQPPIDARRHVALTWEDVSYTVGSADDGSERTLLRHVSGYVQSGEMLAVLGPSGAGKTTLLDILAQRKAAGKGTITGTIMLDGAPVEPAAFRRCTGYVQQEDVMHSYVTVEEAVRFSADLRTPPTVSAEALELRVSRVLRQLRIDHVRHRCIGSATVRGISGGERKRCAVAAELVTSPSLLFLDEPTTGLDTFTALHLLTLLRSLSRSGVAVVFSIHQPRSRIYEVFDRVLLLNGVGEEAYFGPAADALGFLAEIGLPSPPQSNPADYLIDAVSVLPADEEAWLVRQQQQQRQSTATEAVMTEGSEYSSSVPSAVSSKGRWERLASAAAAASSTQGRDIAAGFASLRLPDVLRELDELRRRSPAPSATVPAAHAYYRSWPTQVRHIAVRYLRNRCRDPVATYVSITSAIVFAFLTGTIYYQVGDTQDSIRSRMGVLFFIMMISTFSSLGSLEMFLTDRAIYAREHRNGMYTTSAYYVGKVIQDVPIGVLVNTAFNLIVYLLVGLQRTIPKFLLFNTVGALVMLNSYALCLLMSNLARDHATANILTSLLLVLYLLPTGGMLVSLNSIPLVWRWIKHVSFVRFAFSAWVANEFDGLTFICDPLPPEAVPCITTGAAYAASQGMYTRDVGLYVVFVVASMVVYLVLGYLVLRRWRSSEGK